MAPARAYILSVFCLDIHGTIPQMVCCLQVVPLTPNWTVPLSSIIRFALPFSFSSYFSEVILWLAPAMVVHTEEDWFGLVYDFVHFSLFSLLILHFLILLNWITAPALSLVHALLEGFPDYARKLLITRQNFLNSGKMSLCFFPESIWSNSIIFHSSIHP